MRRELLERGFESSRKMIFAHMDARSNFLERELACQSRINIVPNQLELASTHPSPPLRNAEWKCAVFANHMRTG